MNNTPSPPGIEETTFDSFEQVHGEPESERANGQARPEDEVTLPASAWPDPPDAAVYHGIAGEYVRLIEPHTESDSMAVLVQFLIACGSIIGRGPHFRVENDQHHTNLNAVLVGATGKGRKGTSLGQALRLAKRIDPGWKTENGLSSGEGLIWAVRDSIERDKTVLDGVADKRLFVAESEFSRVLKVATREGNTLSSVIRQAWETGNLQIMTKTAAAKATGAHISIVAHITKPELLKHLDATETANGFANRFLWVAVCRSQFLPEGGSLFDDDFDGIAERLAGAIEWARSAGRVQRDSETRRIWAAEYRRLSTPPPGMLGAATGRAEPQVTRLSLIYALLDKSPVIRPDHQRAALALWRYCADSAKYIFGDALGDKDADLVLSIVREAGADGLTRTQLVDLTSRHIHGGRLDRALQALLEVPLIKVIKETTGGKGRPPVKILAL